MHLHRSKSSENLPTNGAAPSHLRSVVGKERLTIPDESRAADWLRDNIGTGKLSGYFRMTGSVVYVPALDRNDSNSASTNDDSISRLIVPTADSVKARVQYTWRVVNGTKDKLFPRTAAVTALSVPDMLTNIRDLRAVIHTPIVRADGSILDAPGYDIDSRLLYIPDTGLKMQPVSARPTKKAVAQAKRLLLEMIGEFSFTSEHDRANYLGLLLTPLLRELVPPPYKLGAISAPQPGSGKTYLASALRTLHGGVFRSEMPESDTELKKDLLTILTGTTGAVVHFDNIMGTVRSSAFAGLLTSTVYSDRLLGGNTQANPSNDRLWIITGNNVRLGGDLPRRVVWVNIDPQCPETSSSYRVQDSRF